MSRIHELLKVPGRTARDDSTFNGLVANGGAIFLSATALNIYRRDLRRIISEVMIQTLENAMATSNTSTSKFPLETFTIGNPTY
jgi:hypothetical protein